MSDLGSFGHRYFKPSAHEFSDEESSQLLRTLYCYVEHYDWTEDTITSVVVDLAQSMDVTTAAEDQMRSEIEARFS